MLAKIKPIIRYILSQKMNFFKLMMGLLAVKLATTLIPILIGSGIDIISSQSSRSNINSGYQIIQFWISEISQKVAVNQIFIVVCGLLFLSIILLVLAPWQQKKQTHLIQDVVFNVTMDWMGKVFKKDLRFFKEKNAARTASILSRGIHGHEKLMNQMINVILPVVIEFILASAILVQVGGGATLLFIACSFLAQTLITLGLIRRRRPKISVLNDIEDESAEQTQELLSKGLIFQIYKGTDFAIKKLAQIYRKYAEQCVKISFSGAHLSWLPYQFQTLGSIVALVMGYYLLKDQGHSLGQVLILISFFNRFSAAASECIGAFRILDQFEVDVQEAEKILSFKDFSRLGKSILSLGSVKLSEGCLIRNGINLKIPSGVEFRQGDRVALVGPSGSGKSTLLEVLAGLDDDSRAALHWNGVRLSDLNSEQQLQSLKYVPQDPMIFHGTFAENIIQKKPVPDGLIQSLGLEHLRDHSREKFCFKSLSGGEAKRVALVRALGSETGLYLLDEPTAGLNEDLREKTWNTIHEITRPGILISVTHDECAFDRFNKILKVENGVVSFCKWEMA